jgi:REP element-mobilizing transposase RayT
MSRCLTPRHGSNGEDRKSLLRGVGAADTLSLMPPPPRDTAPGLRHIWVHATGHERYYVDNDDRVFWIRQLKRVLDELDWVCVAFCQLSTHVHLIVSVPDTSLPLGMKQLNMAYSRDFNTRHDRVGQFVRRRYGSRRIADGRDLVAAYAYVVLNPVLANLCFRPEDWRWSSYATTLRISNDFSFVDASLAVTEVGGSVEALRRTVDARRRERLCHPAMAGV